MLLEAGRVCIQDQGVDDDEEYLTGLALAVIEALAAAIQALHADQQFLTAFKHAYLGEDEYMKDWKRFLIHKTWIIYTFDLTFYIRNFIPF